MFLKYSKYSFLWLSCFVLIISACEKEVPFPNRDATPLLVVNSIFSANESTSIHLSQTASLAEADPSFITDASLVVEDDMGQTIDFFYEANGIYKAENFMPSIGKKYTVKASTNDLASVSATTIIPENFSYSLVDTSYGLQEGFPSWFYEIEIIDDSEEDNYFLIQVTYNYEDETILPVQTESDSYIPFAHFCFDTNADNTDLLSDTEYSNAGLKAVYLSDAVFDEGRYNITLAVADKNLSQPKEGKTFANLRIRSVSKDLFNYYKSLERYRLNQGNFFAEPVQIFTNINKGTGIFGASNERKEIIDLGKE